jgi:hypothetical protein
MRRGQDLDLRSVQALAILPKGRNARIRIPIDRLLIRVVERLKKMVHAFEVTVDDVQVVYISRA